MSSHPDVEILAHELVVGEMRVSAADPLDLFELPRREVLVRIETPSAFEQSLPPKDFMKPGDASVKVVRGIEKRGVGVGDLHAGFEQVRRNGIIGGLRAVQMLHGFRRPNGPMSQQSAANSKRALAESKTGDQVG